MSNDPAAGGVPLTPAMRNLFADASIVVIDDTPLNVALLDAVLRNAGTNHIYGFTDPREALDACRQRRPDLVLVDLHMPNLDAIDVIEELNSSLPDGAFLPVVVLTADITAEARQRALAAGAKDFLTKPFDVAEVLLRAGNLLETAALHRRLEAHNIDLRRQLDARTAADRQERAEQESRHRAIDRILHRDALSLVFQPIVDLATGVVLGVEALARFASTPTRPPNEWFAEAASVGRGVELELHAIRAAVAEFHRLPPAMFLSVNASAMTVSTANLADVLAGTATDRLIIEITEHERVADYETFGAALDTLRSIGVRIAVDDTGAGYAGLSHILRLQPDILKLDIDLTRGIDQDPVRRSLAAALVAFAADLDSEIIAEGVETSAELTALHNLGVRWAQGYYLARPAPLPPPTHIPSHHRTSR